MEDDAQLMKSFAATLSGLLQRAHERDILGTKMRSVVKKANKKREGRCAY